MSKAEDRKLIGVCLKYWRKKAGLTLGELSVDLDCELSTYQAYELGRAEPTLRTLWKLVDIHGLNDIEQLIDRKRYFSQQAEI